MMPELSVIIPTYEDWHVLPKCLDCLANQSIAQDRFEVIVANNNPSPDLPATLKLAPNVRVIHVPTPGSYAARNAALREARGYTLFFTDSDCQPDRSWIENGLAALARLRPIDRIAGEIELFPKGETWTTAELCDRVHALKQDTYVEEGWCATANLVTTRAAFDLVGPFSEYAFSGGDSEWGLRAAELGSQIVLSDATLIRHPARDSFAAMAKKARRLVGNFHQHEVLGTFEKRALFSYLIPTRNALLRTANDPNLTEAEKLRVFVFQYRLALVKFAECVRLRYLSRTPSRS
ncbi:glycosyltransferase [Tabrizicola piscis]|jgi:glycosyltransferase involved in cell wall biosynthesis|uniref:Glycosyltransferase n=1 Tax=Tabrizicola piscis TaxID=2494374 RepID=A0A3S8U707_9RHOB|nr:glycosyltransferase [Tabrizicola piscis]